MIPSLYNYAYYMAIEFWCYVSNSSLSSTDSSRHFFGTDDSAYYMILSFSGRHDSVDFSVITIWCNNSNIQVAILAFQVRIKKQNQKNVCANHKVNDWRTRFPKWNEEQVPFHCWVSMCGFYGGGGRKTGFGPGEDSQQAYLGSHSRLFKRGVF